METMEQQLVVQRTRYLAELQQTEDAAKQLRTKADELRRKLGAIDTLLGNTETGAQEFHTEAEPSGTDVNDGVFTRVQDYWKPILRSIVEMGGRGRREKVMDAVGQKMKAILTPADYGTLSDSNVIRWRNRVAWQASNMRARGFIKKGSVRGVWEITDEGRKWLDDQNA
jgi:Mrr N-terminal domain